MIASRLVLVLLAAAAPAFGAEPEPPSTAGATQPDVPPAARERLPGPHVTLDASVCFASGSSTGVDEGMLGGGLHFTARPGPIVLAADLQGSTNVFGSAHAFAAAGIGGTVDLEVGRLVLTALYGRHRLEVVEFFADAPEHDLRVLGLRAAWEGEAGRRLRGRFGVAVTSYFDLEREHDAGSGRDVGGVTLLVSLGLGLGI